MSMWTEPSPSDFDRWQEKLIAGAEPSTAAKELGHTCSAFRRADPDRHAAVLEAGREARAGYVDERMELWAVDPDAPPPIRLAWARRWNPRYTDRQEITGAEGGPIEFAVGEARDKIAARLAGIADRRRTASDPGDAE